MGCKGDPGIPCFQQVGCTVSTIWPGGTAYDMHYTNPSLIDWNGWGGVYRVDPSGVDCYTAGDSLSFSVPAGSGVGPGIGLPAGSYPLQVWGHTSIFGGKGSTMEGVLGGGSLAVTCPPIALLADHGTAYDFFCEVGAPLVGPAGNAFVDFQGVTRDQHDNVINGLQYLYTSSTLPPGLTLINTGVPTTNVARLSGTPTVSGVQTFTVLATAYIGGVSSGCGQMITCSVISTHCELPSFGIRLETGGALLLEDDSHLELELATLSGAFLCAGTIPSHAQLFPPTVVGHDVVVPPPGARACASPVEVPLVLVDASAPRPQPITAALSPPAPHVPYHAPVVVAAPSPPRTPPRVTAPITPPDAAHVTPQLPPRTRRRTR